MKDATRESSYLEKLLRMLEDAGLTPDEVRAFRALVKGKR